MNLLVLGVLIWFGVHLMPSAAPSVKQRLKSALGENAYMGVFALSLISAIVLMVMGWRSTPGSILYATPSWGHALAVPLVFLGFFLFAASVVNTNVKRMIRHPQLTGFAVWAGAHLLSNGDSKSLVLFGTLGVWALLEMALINRRDGAWERPVAEPLMAELKPLIGGAVAFAVFFALHSYLFGVYPGPS